MKVVIKRALFGVMKLEDEEYLERASKALKEKGFDIEPEMLDKFIALGKFLEKHPELLAKCVLEA